MFAELFPIIATADMQRALAFYRDALGGKVIYEYPGPDGAVVYAAIQVGSSQVGIGLNEQSSTAAQRPISIWVYADNCDRAVARLREYGTSIVEEPADQPWGERIARVLDPDGNELIVGERAAGSDRQTTSVSASLVSPEPTKYTRPEYERRFLVSPESAWRDYVEPYSKRFQDVYLRHTHLRLRILSDLDSGREYIKLTKKLPSSSAYFQTIGSIPLSPIEYELLSALDGDRITKARHYHHHGSHVFSIDVFEGELLGLVLCEVEAGNLEELMRIDVPPYAAKEVTEDSFFTGGNLSRASRDDLRRKLTGMGLPVP